MSRQERYRNREKETEQRDDDERNFQRPEMETASDAKVSYKLFWLSIAEVAGSAAQVSCRNLSDHDANFWPISGPLKRNLTADNRRAEHPVVHSATRRSFADLCQYNCFPESPQAPAPATPPLNALLQVQPWGTVCVPVG